MKKLYMLLLAFSIVLTACATDGENKESNEETQTEQINSEEVETETDEDTVEETEEEVKNENIVEYNGSLYEVVKAEVVDNEMFPEKKILALHLKFTNNSDEAVNIWFSNPFKAEQETDTTIELLNGANGQFPEDYFPELVKNGDDVDIKPGATVDAVIGYDMLDPDSPVYIRPMFDGDFEFVYNK